MTMAAAKVKLLDFIETADDDKLKELLSYVENNLQDGYEFTDEDIAGFDKEWEGHLAGDGQSVSLDEFRRNIQLHREAIERI